MKPLCTPHQPAQPRHGRTPKLALIHFILSGAVAVGAAAQDVPPRSDTPRGDVIGRVVETATGAPVSGAEVRIAGMRAVAITDVAGAFRLDRVPAGVVSLQVSSLGFHTTIHGDVVVSPAKPVPVTIRLTPAPLEVQGIVVRPSSFRAAIEAPTSTHEMRAEEIRRAPGAWEDVVRAVAVLPGVAPTGVHSNMLVVRGGAPFENLFIVDGLEVPNINHFAAQGGSGGQTSLLNLDLVDRVDFAAGGFGVPLGDRVGSVTTVDLREGLEDRHAVESNLSLTGVGAIVEGPVGQGSYMLALRRSYLDLLLDWSGETFFLRYWDLNAKVTQRLGDRDRLSWTFVGAIDEFGFNIEDAEDAYDAALMATSDDQYFTGLTWTRLGEGSRFTLTAGRVSHAFDGFENDTLTAPLYTNRSSEAENSLRGAFTRSFPGGSTLEVGGVVKYHTPLSFDVSIGGEQRPDGQGDPTPLDVDTSFSALQGAAFAEGTIRWTPRLSTRLGARVDYYGHLGDAVRFAPRAAATYELGGGTSLSLSGGRYWQAPSFIWLVGDPDNVSRLRPLRVDQAVVGVQQLIGREIKVQLEGYYKRYGDYPARLWHPEAVAAPNDFEGVRLDVPFELEPLLSAATGRAYGIEALIQKRLGDVPLYGLASLSLSRSEFTSLDGRIRRGSYDAPVLANLAVGWRPNEVWDFGVRFRAGSGRPVSPFVTSAPYLGRYDLDRFNEGGRMPAFHALDLRIDRRWRFQSAQLTTYLDIQDLYNRDNAIGYAWDFREGRPTYETALGLWPSIGINIEF
jgi:hypothetical protein